MYPKLNTFLKKYAKETVEDREKRNRRIYRNITFSNTLLILAVSIAIFFLIIPTIGSWTYIANSLTFIKPFEGTVLSYVYTGMDNGFYFAELENQDWKANKRERETNEETFEISIPKLGIYGAQVQIDSPNLNPTEMLGHYKGTALPGEVGNSFVYGHSSIPFLYNPLNYKTIFTTLAQGKLSKGDRIIVQMEDKVFNYIVKMQKELLPKEVDPYKVYYPSLYNKSTLTLMTCSPPGTTDKYRYLVISELE